VLWTGRQFKFASVSKPTQSFQSTWQSAIAGHSTQPAEQSDGATVPLTSDGVGKQDADSAAPGFSQMMMFSLLPQDADALSLASEGASKGDSGRSAESLQFRNSAALEPAITRGDTFLVHGAGRIKAIDWGSLPRQETVSAKKMFEAEKRVSANVAMTPNAFIV
jgi:hypothetical protein